MEQPKGILITLAVVIVALVIYDQIIKARIATK